MNVYFLHDHLDLMSFTSKNRIQFIKYEKRVRPVFIEYQFTRMRPSFKKIDDMDRAY